MSWKITAAEIAKARAFRSELDKSLQRSRRSYRREFPRSDEPWQLAEDRRLLALVVRHSDKLKGIKLWHLVSRRLKRSENAVQTRYCALRAGMRIAKVPE